LFTVSRSTKDSELLPIKGGTVVDMEEEQSQQVHNLSAHDKQA